MTEKSLRFAVYTELADLLSLKTLFAQALAESRLSYFSFSPEKFRASAQSVATDPKSHGVLVALQNNQPVGVLYCTIGGLFIGEGAILTTVSLFYVPKHLRDTLLGGKIALGLLAGLESWTAARNGREILVHVNFGGSAQRTHKFLKRSGFETVGGSYAKKGKAK